MRRTDPIRQLLQPLSLAAAVFAAPAYAQIGFKVKIPPPASQFEIAPDIAQGYVWAPGYWNWNWSGERYVWVRRRSIAEREGYRWTPDRWEQRELSYYRTAGHWENDENYKAVKMPTQSTIGQAIHRPVSALRRGRRPL